MRFLRTNSTTLVAAVVALFVGMLVGDGSWRKSSTPIRDEAADTSNFASRALPTDSRAADPLRLGQSRLEIPGELLESGSAEEDRADVEFQDATGEPRLPNESQSPMSTFELAEFDLYQHIDDVETAVKCRLLNPSGAVLPASLRADFAAFLADARSELTQVDAEANKRMFEYVGAHRSRAQSVPKDIDFSVVKRRVLQEQPEGARVVHTLSSEMGESYFVINWGDSIDLDNARLHSGDVKLKIIECIKTYFQ